MTPDRGDWMSLYSGNKFYPLDPRPEEINPIDIAHALSLICRFGGHIDRFYSVAEHCVLMSRAVPEEFALPALLHDATEAYMGDMVRPLKYQMPEYRIAEDKVMEAVAARFGLPSHILPPEVKDADNRILLDERAAFMPNIKHEWAPFYQTLTPLGTKPTGWLPRLAEDHYLLRLTELGVDIAPPN